MFHSITSRHHLINSMGINLCVFFFFWLKNSWCRPAVSSNTKCAPIYWCQKCIYCCMPIANACIFLFIFTISPQRWRLKRNLSSFFRTGGQMNVSDEQIIVPQRLTFANKTFFKPTNKSKNSIKAFVENKNEHIRYTKIDKNIHKLSIQRSFYQNIQYSSIGHIDVFHPTLPLHSTTD